MRRLYRAGLLCLAIVFSVLGNNLFSQLTIDQTLSPEQMAQQLVGEGVDIFNVQVTGSDSSYAYYTSVGTEIGNSEGLLLTTGRAVNAIGPNDESGLPTIDPLGNCLDCDLYDMDFPGDPLLTLANGGLTTWDAVNFEFDIIPQGDTIRFAYTFASEEYLEWVNSPFNDVFGFFITGPNGFDDVNIALVPTTQEAVAINNVNHLVNTEFFYDNQDPLGQQVQYDGFTVNLEAVVGGVIPCEVYHLKLIIADGSDHLYDSGVFISQIESNPASIITTTAGGIDFMIEGCNDGTVTFESQYTQIDPLDIIFTVDGSAEMDIDYTTDPDLGPLYNPLDSTYTITIEPGDSTVSFDILTIEDFIPEGSEFVTITIAEQFCDTILFNSQVNFEIVDSLEVDVQPPTADLCPGQCIDLVGDAITDGSATYEWSPIEGLDDPDSLTPEACPSGTMTYVLTSMVADCVASDSVVITVAPLQLDFAVTNISCEGEPFGAIDLTVLTGVDPYTFEWTGPNDFTADTEDISGLAPGTYCVTVTDIDGCTGEGCVEVIEEDVLDIAGVVFSDFTCFPISCNGECDGSIDITVEGGSGNYTYDWTGPAFTADTEDISGLCAGEYFVTITDDQGCIITDSFIIDEPDAMVIDLDGQVDVLCTGTMTGSACVTATGGCTPYFYSWSHDPILTAPCAIDLGAATYSVTVNDLNGCTAQDSVVIIITEPLEPLDVTVDLISSYPGGYSVSCPDAEDGSIDITITGGIPGYIIQWMNVETGETIFGVEDLSGISCGTWELTVTDSNDCVFEETVIMTCVPDIVVEYTTILNPCGQPNAGLGEIHITNTTGGNGGPYIQVWDSGPSCPCVGPDLVGLNSGDYVLITTDAFGCNDTLTINIGTNQDFTVTPTITDASCGGTCDGAIDLDISPDLGTEIYVWTGPDSYTASTQDIADLCAGEYTLVITQDACEETFIFNVGEPTPIDVDIVSEVPPTCVGQNDGSLEIAVSGGTGVLTVNWPAQLDCGFPGSSGLILNNLQECDYIVVVTDESGCMLTDTISLVAPQVMDIFVEVTEFEGGFNVSCAGAQDGQISVSVSGGTPDCDVFPDYCYLYDWSDCDDVTVFGNDVNSPNITNLSGGSYCVNVTDVNGCLATTTIDLLEPDSVDTDPIISDYNGFGISCFGSNDGYISPNVVGGSGDYDIYEWIDGDIGANDPLADTLINLPPDTYCLYILDSNGCADTSCFVIDEPDSISITIDAVLQVTCFGYTDGAITVSAEGGAPTYTFNWVDQDLNPYVGNVLTNLPSGTYTLTVEDLNGCTATEVVVLEDPDLFQVTLNAPVQGDSTIFTLQCHGDDNASIISLVEGGVPDFTYLWEDCDNNFISDQPTIDGLEAGCFCLTVTDAEGCEAQECIDITEPDEPLTVTPDISLYPGDVNISCAGACDGFINLEVTGGVPDYTYVWHLDGDTTIISVDPNIDDLCSGLYDVLVTDENGCDTTLFVEMIQPMPILSNSIVSEYLGGFNISCADSCNGTITVSPAGGIPGYTVFWADPINSNDTTVTDLCAGTYTLSITDSIGCEIVEVFTLTAPDPIDFAETITNIACFDDGNGSIDAGVTGGNGDYTYTWIPDEGNTGVITDLEAGTYCVTVEDTNGCLGEECFEVDEPDEPLDSDFTSTDADCGECNGTIDVTTSGGTIPYTYDWTGNGTAQGDEDQDELCADDYTVTVTDDNGCTVDLDITVDGPDALEAIETVVQPLCYGDCNGSVTLEITNGADPVVIEWFSDGVSVGTGPSITDICEGEFEAQVTDGEGCEETFNYIIIEPDSITINGFSPLMDNGYNISEFDGSDGSIETDIEGGTPDYTIEWTGPTDIDDGTENPGNLSAGEYLITVTDENGCVKDSIIVVTAPDDLTLPTGFSPNGDGSNDFYVILGIDQHPNNTFIVFNRWGNIVYEKSGYQNEWAGTSQDGDDLPDGTYYVLFEADNRQFNSFVDLRR